jgi:eukaryotic-like serine/threonine-protein kinase
VTATEDCLAERTIADLATGRLETSARAAAAAHVDGCATCRARVADASSSAAGGTNLVATALHSGAYVPRPRAGPEPAPLARGTTVGRYTILDLVGKGGMGEVYAAYDPELDRRIALKLLRAELELHENRAEARLLREAKAIARVSHANVVTVHDTGTFGGRVFIAMEFVDGATLRDWLDARPRGRDEILRVFVAAARGLDAAHAADLVHRDFKPQNVMVGEDGGVRVMDFGLVRQLGAPGDDAPPRAAAEVATTEASFELTQTGELLGTPRFMAPEQFKAEPTDARTDQFSFCVALYEALYGQRPFEGDTLPVLMTNVVSGHITPPPSKAGVPGWLRRVLLRGLETSRDRRFASMSALIAALETDPTARARRWRTGAAVVAGLALAIVAARHLAGQRQAPCRGGAQRWAAVWTADGAASARKDTIHRAFVATGRGYAEQAFSGASRLLDDYVRAWLGMYDDACEATHVRGEQSPEVLDLRMSCLGDRLTSASALTDLFTQADGTVVENAVSAAAALPRLDRCANVAALKTVVEPPADGAQRARVDALRAEQARLVALRDAGLCQDAERLAESLIPRARAASYLPLLADTLDAAGMLSDQCVETPVGVERFEQAFTAALASRNDEAAAVAAILLAGTLADRTEQIARARSWLDIASAMLRRFDNHAQLDAWFLVSEGFVLLNEGHDLDAAEAFRKSRIAKEKLGGKDDPDAIMSLNDVGDALERAGHYDDALAATRAAREACVRTLGADHPKVAMISNNEGEELNALRRHGEAEVAFRRALGIWRKVGTDPVFLSYGLTGLGVALIGQKRPDEAVAPLEQALATRVEKHLNADLVNGTRLALAKALWVRPEARARARGLAETARAELARSATPASRVALASVDAWLAAPSARL